MLTFGGSATAVDHFYGIHDRDVSCYTSKTAAVLKNVDSLQSFHISNECVRYKDTFFIRVMSWWRYKMEAFSALLSLCAVNSPVTGEFPAKGQWRGALIFSLICDWINGWVNNREAGDLRCHRTHYDVLVMKDLWTTCWDLLKLYYEWLSMCNVSILSKILRNYLF